jgi:PKD repeat protein
MKNTIKLSWMIFSLLIISLFISCSKEETEPDVIASFTYKVDSVDFKKITFTSESQNFATLSWDFGDGSAVSTEINPVHTYAALGEYTVKLTASSPKGVNDVYTEVISISDPNAMLTMLVGDVSKTWKLIRQTTTGRYPLECGPSDHSTIWWGMGKDNDELAKRPCLLNDEWTFGRNGKTLVLNLNGDIWRESQGWFADPVDVCGSTSDPLLGPNGEDLSPWAGGNFHFELTTGATPTLDAIGLGAYIGHFKLGNGAETKVPIDHVLYNVIKLTDGNVDTLIVEGSYNDGGGYWRYVLVHYDNPAEEPPIPGNKPNTSFTSEINGLSVTFTNTTVDGETYLWDFGDGQTSTETNPVHTYATQGIYNVLLTATNTNGSGTASTVVFLGIDLSTFTDAMLQGNPWKVRAEDKSVFVGDGMGHSNWWSVPKDFFITGSGTDDWTCMPDDEFIFGAGGTFEYKTNGSARNDGYMGAPNGCWSDAQIAASGNGAAFGSCATHTYILTPGATPIITLTNGAGFAAFIGFYKGYNGVGSGIKGGENNGTDPPNFGSATNTYQVMGYANSGTKEYLFVSVDITAPHDGTASWSAILER